ncbi:hypothetical protein Tco_0954389 [Tanacetum coccineum]|uniref:Uncharacterized protein n=1 Tax=Tanacetum coccineum TaxID=301880 RepID=A0ABQ5E4E2_9ASTR
MSADFAVTYTYVHSEARSWSIPSKDPYEEAARQLLSRSPTFSRMPAEDEAPTPPLPPFFLSPRIRPLHTRAAMAQMRATAPSLSFTTSSRPPPLALEARVTMLETKVRHHEWQRQAADNFVVRHIMRTQALEARARVDTLEDTGSSS